MRSNGSLRKPTATLAAWALHTVGLVALVAGIVWGSKLGVQFSLQQVALKALPVVILGGLTSVPGAIVGGSIPLEGGKSYVRFAFCKRPEVLTEALRRLSRLTG